MAKSGSGAIANAGKSKGKFVSWDAGLTDADKTHLQVVAEFWRSVILTGNQTNNHIVRLAFFVLSKPDGIERRGMAEFRKK